MTSAENENAEAACELSLAMTSLKLTSGVSSLTVLEYAKDIVNISLLPADARRRARASSLLSWQHSGLSGICANLSYESSFYPEKRQRTADECSDANRLFEVWGNELIFLWYSHVAY
jgi:hypothetical protein